MHHQHSAAGQQQCACWPAALQVSDFGLARPMEVLTQLSTDTYGTSEQQSCARWGVCCAAARQGPELRPASSSAGGRLQGHLFCSCTACCAWSGLPLP